MGKSTLPEYDPRGGESVPRGNSAGGEQAHARTVLWSAGDYGSQLLFWFAATPFLVESLGAPRYGVWMFAQAIIGFSWVFSFGIGDGIIRHVSRLRGEGNHAAVPGLLRSAVAAQAILGLCAGTAVALAASTIVSEGVPAGSFSQTEATAALRIAGAGVFFRFLDGSLTAALYAHHRYDSPAAVNIPTAAVILGGSVWLAAGGWSLAAILALSVTVGGAGILAKGAMLRRQTGIRLLRDFRLEFSPAVDILRFGLFVWLQGLAWALLTQADRFLIVALRSVEELTYYVIPFQAAHQIQAVMARASAFVFPLFSSRRAEGKTAGVEESFVRTVHWTTAGAAGLGMPFVVLAGPLLARWMGEEFAVFSAFPLQVLAAVFTLASMSIGPMYLLNASGRERLTAWLAVGSALVVTALTAVLLPAHGIAGAAVAKALMLPTTALALVIAHPDSPERGRFIAWIVLPLFVVLAAGLAAAPLFDGMSLGWTVLIATGVAMSWVGALLVFVIRRLLPLPSALRRNST